MSDLQAAAVVITTAGELLGRSAVTPTGDPEADLSALGRKFDWFEAADAWLACYFPDPAEGGRE